MTAINFVEQNDLDGLLALSTKEHLRGYQYAEYVALWREMFGDKDSGKRTLYNGRGAPVRISVGRLDQRQFVAMRQELATATNELGVVVAELYLLF